jgi:hypothetical protein
MVLCLQASSDPAILEVTDNGDGTAKVKAVGPVGTAQVQVSADADLGEGVKTVTGVADVEVVAGFLLGVFCVSISTIICHKFCNKKLGQAS